MNKKFFMGIAAMAALTLVSCSSDDLDSVSDNSSKNEAISFDGYLGRSAVAVNGSRGSELTKDALQESTEGFGVFGNYTSTDVTTTTYGENLFKNQQVTYDATAETPAWTYEPVKYWSPAGHIDFLAYAPFDSNQKLKENSKLDFTVNSTITAQKDLLWANAANKTNTDKPVTFIFKHALSRLGYTVKLSGNYSPDNATFTLKKITLAGSPDETTKAFYTKGTIDLSKVKDEPTGNVPAGLWNTSSSDKQNFDWVSTPYDLTSTDASDPDKDNYLFVIPQDFSKEKDPQKPTEVVDELYVIVQYTITYSDGGGEQTNTVYKQIKKKFEQGKAYMLNLTIGLPIEFDIDVDTVSGVENWEEVNDVPGNIDSWDDINRK